MSLMDMNCPSLIIILLPYCRPFLSFFDPFCGFHICGCFSLYTHVFFLLIFLDLFRISSYSCPLSFLFSCPFLVFVLFFRNKTFSHTSPFTFHQFSSSSREGKILDMVFLAIDQVDPPVRDTILPEFVRDSQLTFGNFRKNAVLSSFRRPFTPYIMQGHEMTQKTHRRYKSTNNTINIWY